MASWWVAGNSCPLTLGLKGDLLWNSCGCDVSRGLFSCVFTITSRKTHPGGFLVPGELETQGTDLSTPWGWGQAKPIGWGPATPQVHDCGTKSYMSQRLCGCLLHSILAIANQYIFTGILYFYNFIDKLLSMKLTMICRDIEIENHEICIW